LCDTDAICGPILLLLLLLWHCEVLFLQLQGQAFGRCPCRLLLLPQGSPQLGAWWCHLLSLLLLLLLQLPLHGYELLLHGMQLVLQESRVLC
jgi:hypothetical protein